MLHTIKTNFPSGALPEEVVNINSNKAFDILAERTEDNFSPDKVCIGVAIQGIEIAKAKGIYQLHAGKGKMTDQQFLEQHSDIIEL